MVKIYHKVLLLNNIYYFNDRVFSSRFEEISNILKTPHVDRTIKMTFSADYIVGARDKSLIKNRMMILDWQMLEAYLESTGWTIEEFDWEGVEYCVSHAGL